MLTYARDPWSAQDMSTSNNLCSPSQHCAYSGATSSFDGTFIFVENVDIAFFERKFSIQGKYSSGRLWEMHVMETPEEVFGNG